MQTPHPSWPPPGLARRPWVHSRAVPLLAAIALLSGCGGDEASDPGTEGGDPLASVDTIRDDDLPTLIESRIPSLDASTEDNVRRRDPSVDGWESEVLHDLAKARLGEVIHGALHPDPDHPHDLQGDLDGEFEGITALRATEFETTRTAAGYGVARASQLDGELHPAGKVTEILESYLDPIASDPEARVDKKIIGVERHGDGRFTTPVLAHAIGSIEGGRQLQMNASWNIEWQSHGDGDSRSVRIRKWTLESYEEVRSPGPIFEDITQGILGDLPSYQDEFLLGVDDYHLRMDQHMGGSFLGMQGMALGDIDGNGLDDLYLCQQGGLPNRLLLRQLDGSVVEAAAEAQLNFLDKTRSALILDVDADGSQDIVIGLGAHILVARNNGRGQFPNDTLHRVWLAGEGTEDVYSLSAADPDGDGDLDFYACRYVQGGVTGGVPTPYFDAMNGASNFYWRCDGPMKYTLANAEVGLDVDNTRFSLSSTWEDFDDDGDLDLYVTNDFGRNNLFLNEGGKFRDVATEYGAADQASGMGVSCSDVDLDGDIDMYITNMFSSAGLRIASQEEQYMRGQNRELHDDYLFHARGNTLLLNNGNGTFEDGTEAAGVSLGRWAWGSIFTDLDNDGYDDIYVPNGFVTSKKDPDDL